MRMDGGGGYLFSVAGPICSLTLDAFGDSLRLAAFPSDCFDDSRFKVHVLSYLFSVTGPICSLTLLVLALLPLVEVDYFPCQRRVFILGYRPDLQPDAPVFLYSSVSVLAVILSGLVLSCVEFYRPMSMTYPSVSERLAEGAAVHRPLLRRARAARVLSIGAILRDRVQP